MHVVQPLKMSLSGRAVPQSCEGLLHSGEQTSRFRGISAAIRIMIAEVSDDGNF